LSGQKADRPASRQLPVAALDDRLAAERMIAVLNRPSRPLASIAIQSAGLQLACRQRRDAQIRRQARRLCPGPQRYPVDQRTATIEQLIESGTCFAGTPDNVYNQINALNDSVGGFGNLLMFGQGGFLDHADTVANITLFAKEVPPRLRELNPTSARAEGQRHNNSRGRRRSSPGNASGSQEIVDGGGDHEQPNILAGKARDLQPKRQAIHRH
jgi:hypothetical protein